MGLESANYISDLVPTWPLGTDKIRQGDDHLREIKKAIKNTFPNINGPVTTTPAVLNALPANLSAIVTELIEHVVPMGVILAWSGAIAAIPVGWALCNGQTVAGFGVTPDLRDRFLVGAGNSYAVGASGGVTTGVSTAAGGHDHGGVTGGHGLTAAETGAHSHALYAKTASDTDSDTQGFGSSNVAGLTGQTTGAGPYGYVTSALGGGANKLVQDAGSGTPHTHPITAQADHTHTVDVLPPYYALAYIVKVTQYVAP